MSARGELLESTCIGVAHNSYHKNGLGEMQLTTFGPMGLFVMFTAVLQIVFNFRGQLKSCNRRERSELLSFIRHSYLPLPTTAIFWPVKSLNFHTNFRMGATCCRTNHCTRSTWSLDFPERKFTNKT